MIRALGFQLRLTLLFFRSLFVALVYQWRRARLPESWLLVRELKLICRYWSDETALTFVKSAGRTLPMDQQFHLSDPRHYQGLVPTGDEYRLTEEEIEGFYRQGFLEPIQVWPEEMMEAFGDQLMAHLESPSQTYGFPTRRDRHLDGGFFLQMMTHPAIVERVAQLLGPDLKLWRSYVFHKPPGGKRVTWHQESSYMYENKFVHPIVLPVDPQSLFQLTVWVAVTETTLANGCLQVVPGTHRSIHNLRLGGGEGYESAAFQLDFQVDSATVRPLEMRPGQAIILSERVIHGSEVNTTRAPRTAFNFRFVRGDATVHPHVQRNHYAAQLKQTFDMSRWREVVIRGENLAPNLPSIRVDDLLQELGTPPVGSQPHDPAEAIRPPKRLGCLEPACQHTDR